VQKVLMRA